MHPETETVEKQRDDEAVASAAAAHAPLPRWVPPLLAAVAVGLVPWTLWLTFSLPSRHVAHHYRIAWVGFDVGLATAFALTAVAAMRFSRWIQPAATVTATLLVCDAWFDVVTSGPGFERVEAALEAGLAELPLAAVCAWVVRDVQRYETSILYRYVRNRQDRRRERAAARVRTGR